MQSERVVEAHEGEGAAPSAVTNVALEMAQTLQANKQWKFRILTVEFESLGVRQGASRSVVKAFQ